ncbi:hypothetical protein TREMEDRAFT_61489 [Tremella mesenterica DSM 1558]|uniref:uncharacterized protein n=1 Tax=Tremella mesenterica (strain ATCC 24925 / CBS 8224 / DSM 1558 / NBRC 9311 / NRRL Y-6157 / RJB 2259-6 / UBC 559-6) TaxID=578456 RepID=UPI0003F491C9|nr:uncharacterized protein TREMEDRAFT_61489 [Tremella mesenterica DSM 1558]EIW69728.1 hypothetical protein TREMEDRAFT_61489 [Tremella mesenterica DSM 1558]
MASFMTVENLEYSTHSFISSSVWSYSVSKHAATWMCAAKKAVAAREQELLARIRVTGQDYGQRMMESAPVMTQRPAEMARTLPPIIPECPPYPFYPSPHFLPGVAGPSNWYQRPPTYPPVSNYSSFPPTFYPPVYPSPHVQEGLGNGSNFAERSVLEPRHSGMRQEFPPSEYRPREQDSTGGQGGGR